MKRSVFYILCLLLAAALIGCTLPAIGSTTPETTAATKPTVPPEPTFAQGILAAGIDVSNLTVSQAYERINEKATAYTLTATINDTPVYFSGSSLALTCSREALESYAAAQAAGKSTEDIQLLLYDKDVLSGDIFNAVNTPAQDAVIVYNADSGLFEFSGGSEGMKVDMEAVTEQLHTAIQHLEPAISLESPLEPYAPEFCDTNPEAVAALDKANRYLTTEITYNFPVDDEPAAVTLDPVRIADMVAFDENQKPYIRQEALSAYVEELNSLYGMTGMEGSFNTTRGAQTDLTVTYYASYLDTQALYQDILDTLERGIPTTKTAPSISNPVPQEMPFKGSYIEVDLTNQTLYLYKDTQCILETPIVTGCISRYMRTPNGVYKVLVRRMHVILKGEDYETYVKYWMQFYGGYGLHDAYWRYKFGGNEYLYNGSHGCVNIPPDNAEFVFNNISVGYPVILHGGATNDGPLQQSIVGTEEYNTNIHTKPFQLDAQTAIGTGKLKYTSSNPAVATVDEDGIVTVHKKGSSMITAEYEESRYYTAASMHIKIRVNEPCPTQHSFGQWETTLAPTCVKGSQKRICTDCGLEENRSVAATDPHTYGDWEQVKKPKCQDGQERKVCSVCSHEMNRTIPAEHNLRDWRIRTEATCDAPGENYRACRNCDYEETEVLPALGHSFTPDEEFCENCDTPNPHWIPPTEPPKEEDGETEEPTA